MIYICTSASVIFSVPTLHANSTRANQSQVPWFYSTRTSKSNNVNEKSTPAPLSSKICLFTLSVVNLSIVFFLQMRSSVGSIAASSHMFSGLGPAEAWFFSMRNSIFWLKSQGKKVKLGTVTKVKDLHHTRSTKI